MRKYVLALCAIFLISGCAGMSYSQKYDPAVNFAQLRTYSVMPLPEKKREDTLLLLKNMRFSVDKALQAKGYTRDDNNPDFFIALHAITENKVDVQQYGYAYSTGFYEHPAYLHRPDYYDRHYGYRYAGPDSYEYRSGVDVYEYRVGTMVVDVVKAEGKELVWRGIAEGVLNDNITQENISMIIANILKGFPPPAIK